MKKVFITILCFLLFLPFGFPVQAKSIIVGNKGEVTTQLPERYNVITKSNLENNEDVISNLGKTTSEMGELFESSGFLFYAVSSDYSSQIYLMQQENVVSKTIGNLNDLSGSALENAKQLLISGITEETTDFEVETFRKDLILFYRAQQTEKLEDDSQAIYYLTVVDEKSYVLCFVKEKDGINDVDIEEIQSVAENLVIKKDNIEKDESNAEQKTSSLKTVVNGVLIAVAAIFSIALIISIYRDIHKKRLESDYRKKAPRKPRR